LLLDYLAGESGLLSLIGLVLVAGWLVYRWQAQPKSAHPPAVLAGEPLA
jgi:hypothetical protein